MDTHKLRVCRLLVAFSQFGCYVTLRVFVQLHSIDGWLAAKMAGNHNPGFVCTMHQQNLYSFEQFSGGKGWLTGEGVPLSQQHVEAKIVPYIKDYFKWAFHHADPAATRQGFYLNGSRDGVQLASYKYQEIANALELADKESIGRKAAQAVKDAEEKQRAANQAKAEAESLLQQAAAAAAAAAAGGPAAGGAAAADKEDTTMVPATEGKAQ